MNTLRTNKINSAGFTLVEVLVSIIVATLVGSLIMYSYVWLSRNFHFQTKRAETLQEIYVAKKTIDAGFRDIKEVVTASDVSVEFRKTGNDTLFHVRYAGKKLEFAEQKRSVGLDEFSFRLENGNSREDPGVLVYDGKIKGRWIGGAQVVKVGRIIK